MSTLSKNKTRFRDNLKQFIELKEAGKLNGAAAQIKEKLKAAAGAVDLDFLKEYKTVYKNITRKNPEKQKALFNEDIGNPEYEKNPEYFYWVIDEIKDKYIVVIGSKLEIYKNAKEENKYLYEEVIPKSEMTIIGGGPRKNPCGCEPRTNPETETVCVDDINCEVTVKANTNAQKGGIEIRFSDEPPGKIREQLKDAGFFFYTPKDKPPFWTAEITTARKELAEKIAGKFDSAVLKGKKKTDSTKAKTTDFDNDLKYELGAETTVDFKADGSVQKIGDYAIVEVKDLQASHNKDCSVNSKHEISRSQPRDRSKEALCAQPSFIAKNLNPASITQGNLAFVGSPVVNANAHAIQGNGRSIALKIAYDEVPKSANKYREYLIDNASTFGFNKIQVESFNQPVLVRMLPVENEEAIELGNVVDTSQAKMSKIDQAKAYIRNLSENQLLIIGKLIQNSSGETIGAIIDDVGMDIIKQIKKLDRTGIVEKNKLTGEGKDFLRSVLVGLVFDSEAHPNALHHYMKLPHNIKAGLERSFGYIIPLIDNKGDVRSTLSRAVEVAAQTYQNKAINTAKEYAGSQDMFEAKDFSKKEVALAQFLLDASTQKEIRDAFNHYDELLKGKENLFGKVPPKSKDEAFKIVFIDRSRPNPESYKDEVIHKTIVRAQRLQTLGNDNSKELEKLDYLLGKDGWKWNGKGTKIIRLDNAEDRFERLVILKQFQSDVRSERTLESFKKWLKKEYPGKKEKAELIWNSHPYGAWRSNPAKLTADVKRSVLDDFYAWIKGNPLMDYRPGKKTFENWIPYHYPGYENKWEDIWATARPMARENPTPAMGDHAHVPEINKSGVIMGKKGDQWEVHLVSGEKLLLYKDEFNVIADEKEYWGDDEFKPDPPRENPKARFIYIGVCDKMLIDNGQPDPITLQGPHGLLTNKSMDKLFVVPFTEMQGIDDEIADWEAEKVFKEWHNYTADENNYEVNWPNDHESYPVGTARAIYYVSDKVMREYDGKGKLNMYHHDFDPGKRPCVKKGKLLIVSNLEINENGILN